MGGLHYCFYVIQNDKSMDMFKKISCKKNLEGPFDTPDSIRPNRIRVDRIRPDCIRPDKNLILYSVWYVTV